MNSRMRIPYADGLNKRFGLEFYKWYKIWQAPKESQRMQKLKFYDYNNQDELSSLKKMNI